MIRLEPAHRVFFGNLRDLLLLDSPKIDYASEPAAFWPDVFVVPRIPWLGFFESVLWHLAALAGLWALSHVWLLRPSLVTRPTFSRADVLYYAPSEYLPPIDTGGALTYKPQKGDPEFARQPILSVPRESDNRTQTIVTPPAVKIAHEVAIPNMVAWNEATPAMPLSATTASRLPVPAADIAPVAPAPEVKAAHSRRISGPETTAVAPAPEVGEVLTRHLSALQAGVVAPSPTIQGELRKLGDINIGRTVVGPAPQLPVAAQRVPASSLGIESNAVVPPPPAIGGAMSSGVGRVSALGNASGQPVPPPPSIPGTELSADSGKIIALGIHPAAGPPPSDLAGNRRGRFAASPEGKLGASGTPNITASSAEGKSSAIGQGRGNGGGASGFDSGRGIPSGIYVGPAPGNAAPASLAGVGGAAGAAGAGSTAPPAADTRPMRVTVTPRTATTSNTPPSEVERSVFHNRKSYSMILNMPNLNSAGGSWIIRFAEKVQEDGNSDLTAPEATRKVDPGYPAELMRQNVHGTVILYAVIHRDGSVGDVRVLSSVDERLDQFARAALSRWQFRPATRNGSAIDLEAVVTIPFRPRNNF